MPAFLAFIKNNSILIVIGIILIAIIVLLVIPRFTNQVDLPSGETRAVENSVTESNRQVFMTENAKHSIPLNEIISGGPPKDGIPSIDNPKFVSVDEANEFLDDEEVGLGVVVDGEARFYPYQILVWHEIVNDTIQGMPVLVTYCPLCATGIVFERTIEGEPVEFGVSGKLWQSNLLMYNRTDNPNEESLWSQVLGEAVVGPHTGTQLNIVSSDTVRYGNWKNVHPETKVLSLDTGANRPYGRDPYEGYYTSDSVGFGTEFSDTRLGPKEFVLGVEINGEFKAYPQEAIPVGTITDTFNGELITIERDEAGRISMFTGTTKEPLPYVSGFWFSWVAVHPDTELFK